jgi:probable rRNA maturation factor
MIEVQVAESISPPASEGPDIADIERCVQAALLHENAPPDTSLAVVITGDDQLQTLNRQFLGIDAPTDVLSFPAGENELDPDTGEVYLGDVLISYPRAQAQSVAGGHPVKEELRLLVVHGVLHLLGYDHARPVEKTAMWAAQAEILGRLGTKLQPPE